MGPRADPQLEHFRLVRTADPAGRQAGAALGAGPGEVVVTDTTSLNLFKALAAALRIQQQAHPERKVILSERDNFPTDLYMIQGMIEFLQQGYELRLIDEALPLEQALDEDVAVLLLSHVNYRTGYLYDMAEVTRSAHQRGALTIWDLAHAAGAVEVGLNAAGADFAVGCTYKYLNGGPGSPAFIWVAPRHQNTFWRSCPAGGAMPSPSKWPPITRRPRAYVASCAPSPSCRWPWWNAVWTWRGRWTAAIARQVAGLDRFVHRTGGAALRSPPIDPDHPTRTRAPR